MSSRSFKKVPAGAPQGYRTPSPPPVELISPASASNTRASSFIDNRYGVDYERKSKATLLGVYGNTGDDTESEDEVTGVPTKTNPLPAASIEGQVLAGNHAATIDALATIALATSPKYASKPDHIPHLGSFSPQRPLVRPSYAQAILPAQLLTYVGHHEIEERPSKRARSEAFTTSIQTAEQRPTTSYISNNLWSPVGSQTQWNHGGPSKLRGSAASDSMSNDAELLLNLARATTFSPETNTFRGFPLINGERHSPKTMPTRSQLPPEYGKDLKEPQMPLVSENEGPAASQRLTTEATVDESNFVETSGEQSRFQSIPFGEDENITRTGEEISAPCLPISNLDKDSMEVDSGNNSHNTPPSNVKVRPNHRGWPKGKPRGPRATWGGQKSVKNASGANGGSVSRPRRQTARRKETRNILQAAQSRGFDDTSPPARRRQVSLPPVLQQPSEPLMRRHSASEVSAAFDGRLWMQKFLKSSKAFSLGAQDNSSKSKSGSGGSGNTKRPKSLQSAVCTKCNFTRNTLLGDNDSNATSWISCDGCKSWFHFACAGFKSEREVRSVDKYICRDCRPKSGPTTFVRKSTRAHTAIDYAGLNEGVVKSSDENHEHHYIKPIKEGTITFLPENFARMRPELVTAEFFEKGNGMKEPVVIPAWMNPRPPDPAAATGHAVDKSGDELLAAGEQPEQDLDTELFRDYDFGYVPNEGQDALDMVIPQNLTVRRVAELYGPEEKVEVIDVKSQEGEDKKWNMRRWADYYESTDEKVVRNVISLEVSSSKLGRLIKRPEIVRKLDLQDSVWPAELLAKGEFPRVQFYCLMSVADCFTDFHIDFGGSSVFYHILKGKKTFLFIPPKNKHLKKYEEWCLSPAQNWTFLPDQTNECYRVDLSEGDTMLIPSGWIHAVWTPENSLVIGGNFLTRLNFGMQIRIAEIEKNTKVARKFRYPHFQKIQWLTAIQYLEEDPLPGSVVRTFYDGQSFFREVPAYYEFNKFGANSKPGPENYHARYYSQYELEGLPELARYLLRTALISMGSITEGITTETRNAVARSIPKGHGEPLEIAKKFAMWLSWKRGNEVIPHWAYPDVVPASAVSGANEKKLSAAAIRRLEREAALEVYRVAPERQSARKQQAEAANSRLGAASAKSGTPSVIDSNASRKSASKSHRAKSKLNPINGISPSKQNPLSTPKTSVLGPKRIACDGCRKRRVRCRHKGPDEASPGDVRRNTAIAVVITNNSKDTQTYHTLSTNDHSKPELRPNGMNHAEAEEDNWSSEAQGDNITVEVWTNPDNRSNLTIDNTDQQQNSQVATATIPSSPTSLKGSLPPSRSKSHKKKLVNGGLSLSGESHSKKGRNKACNDCRKSKRRCVHDEIGNVDPVKAQESATPRGSSSKKHSRDTTFDGENRLSKRPKSDDDEIFSGPTSPISVIPSYQEVAVQDRIPSPETRHEPAMNAEPYRTVAVPHMGAVEPVAETKPTLNSTIRLEPVHNLMDGIGANVESAGHLMKGRTQQFTSPPDSVRQNDIITQGHEGQTVGGQNLQRKDSVDLPGTIEDEVQLVETKPSPPALVGHSEPSVTSNENSESVELVRQDTIVPKPTFEASKAPVQGAMQSIEHDKNPVTQSLQNSTGDHPTEQGRQAIASLSEQQNSSAEPHLQDVTTFSPPLTPIQNRLKSEPMTSLLSRRSSRQPKEIQRFSTEQSNGIQAPEKARRPSSNTPTVQTNGVSWSPELQPRRRSSTKKTPSRPNGSITKTSKNATTQRTNGVNNPITDGPRKSAGCEAKQNGRASTSEASVEEDEDMRLARELAEMEFGLRRRGGR